MAHDERETEMMSVRWNYFSFHHQIAERDQRVVAPCNKCFCTLVLQKELQCTFSIYIYFCTADNGTGNRHETDKKPSFF